MSQRRPARASLSAALAAAMSLLGAVPVALGQAPPPSVTWSAPPECPDEAYVRTAVQQLLGPDDPAAARVEAHARVERMADSTWRVHLTTQRDGATGERVVDATSCRSLADATALIVALAIDPQRVAANRPSVAAAAGSSPSASASAAPSSSSSSAPAPVSASATPLPPTPPPAPTPSPRSAPVASPALALAPTPEPPPAPLPTSRFSVFAALAGDLGTLPRPAYGVTLGAALFPWPALRVEAYGSFWPSQHASFSSSSTPGAGGDFFLADGGARACWLPLHANLEIAACPGLEVGVLHGQGDDITHPSSADSVWFAFTGLGRLTWRVGPSLAFFLDLSLALPPFRDVFQLSGDTIHQAGFVEGRASLGPELRF